MSEPSRDHVAAIAKVVATKARLVECEIRAARRSDWRDGMLRHIASLNAAVSRLDAIATPSEDER